MCGSSSTTTTVPFSALTHLAFHLAHPELPESGHPLQPSRLPNRPLTPPVHHLLSGFPKKDPTSRGFHMPSCRRHLSRLWVLGLVSYAIFGYGSVRAVRLHRGSSCAICSTCSSGSNDVLSMWPGSKAKAGTQITDRPDRLRLGDFTR